MVSLFGGLNNSWDIVYTDHVESGSGIPLTLGTQDDRPMVFNIDDDTTRAYLTSGNVIFKDLLEVQKDDADGLPKLTMTASTATLRSTGSDLTLDADNKTESIFLSGLDVTFHNAAGSLQRIDGVAFTYKGTQFLGKTSSAAPPSTTEYPLANDWGFHKDTGTAALLLAFNDGGSVKKIALV